MSRNEPNAKIDNDFESTYLKNILRITFIYVVCSTVLVYIIVYVIGHWLPEDLFNIVQVGNSQSWIGFAGSILGGSMTMFAVVFTIRFEGNKRKEQKKNEDLRDKEKKASIYLPILEFETTGETSFDSLELYLESVTNMPIRNFELVSVKCNNTLYSKNLFSMPLRSFISGKKNYDSHPLTRSGHEKIKMVLDKSSIPDNFQTEVINLVLEFAYSDALQIKRYKHQVELDIRLTLAKNKTQYTVHTIGKFRNIPLTESVFIEIQEI